MSHSLVNVNTRSWISAVRSVILWTCHCWLIFIFLFTSQIRTFLCSWIQQNWIAVASPASSTLLEIVNGSKESIKCTLFFFFLQVLYNKSPLEGQTLCYVLCPSSLSLSLCSIERGAVIICIAVKASEAQSLSGRSGYQLWWLGDPESIQACRAPQPVLSPASMYHGCPTLIVECFSSEHRKPC